MHVTEEDLAVVSEAKQLAVQLCGKLTELIRRGIIINYQTQTNHQTRECVLTMFEATKKIEV